MMIVILITQRTLIGFCFCHSYIYIYLPNQHTMQNDHIARISHMKWREEKKNWEPSTKLEWTLKKNKQTHRPNGKNHWKSSTRRRVVEKNGAYVCVCDERLRWIWQHEKLSREIRIHITPHGMFSSPDTERNCSCLIL